MAYNWIDPKAHSINAILLMDKWMLEHLLGIKNQDGLYSDEDYRYHLAIVISQNPHIEWYILHKCEEALPIIKTLKTIVPKYLNAAMIEESYLTFLKTIETYLVYVYPKIMANLDYIKKWNPNKLLELTNFTDKIVLDIGSGTGRLAFAVAQKAKHIYAVEPVDALRTYMRKYAADNGINNITIVDGTIEQIPYPDNTFDIVMSAHVMGDDYKKEYQEMTRVLKRPGILIDCPGEDGLERSYHEQNLEKLGFTMHTYKDSSGITVPRAIKYITK